jgi:hypothetical protein
LLQNIVPQISFNSKHVCTICPLARHHRLPFVSSSSVLASPFDLIYCDIYGPFFTKSINGSSYFLTIVDDYNRFTWVHLLQNKSLTRTILQSFFILVQTQYNTKIKCVRFDNGLEFKMDDFFLFLFSKQGTIHQLSCVETPQ